MRSFLDDLQRDLESGDAIREQRGIHYVNIIASILRDLESGDPAAEQRVAQYGAELKALTQRLKNSNGS